MIDLQKQRHSLWQQIKTSSFLLPFFFALTSVALLISLISPLAPVSAQSNSETLNFQGRLLTSTGGLVPDGVYNVEFNLYSQASGGSSLWTEDRLNTNTQGVTVRNGYFSVYLGELDAFGAINWDQDLYLGMTIRGTASCAWGSCTPADSEMTPRFKLSSVPYAFRAANVASSSTNAATTNSNDVSIASGNALGSGSDSGNVTIDVGTATGTTGQLLFGTSNASALTFGNSTTNPNYTFQGTGTFTIDSLDCTSNANSGKLTANASGQISCADDVGGGASSTTINSLSGTLTLQGTANEIEVTDNATDTITIGLPDDVTIGSDLTVTDTATVTGLLTANGDFTIEAGDTFTFNSDAFTDFTGGGLYNNAGVLSVDTTSSGSGFFQDGGNSFGAGAVLGTNDTYSLTLETDGTAALTIDASQGATFAGGVTVTGLLTANGGLTIEVGDNFTFNGDAFTDLTGTGLQINSGSLEAILGDNIEDAEVDDDITISSAGSVDGGALVNATVTNNKLANSQLAVNTGSGLTGGGNISLGGSRNLSLGDLTADWVQAGGYDIILDNAGSELRILEASGGLYYGEIDVADLSADRLYTFPDADGEVSLLGQVIENAELQNSLVTVTAGTGLSGGGNVSLGGSITLNNAFGTSIDGSEITDGTIEAIDLEVTGAPTDDYILTYDSTSGGFTWIDPAAAGVTLSEAEVEDFIFDGDNGAKVLSSGTLALGSLSYTGVLTDTNVSDTLTVGASSTVDDGALSANVTLLGSSIALGTETTGNYVESITTGNGLQGGATGVGSTPTLALGAFTANWNQSGAYDIVLDNSASELQILDDGGSYYGIFNVSGGIGSDQTFEFTNGGTVITSGNIASNATTGVTPGTGLTGGGTVGVLSLNVNAGTGITVNADDIEVNYGSSAGTAVEGNTTITVSAGTGLSGGGLLTLGAGGTLTLNSNLGDDIDSSEIVDGTIQEEDLETTNAATDNYVLTYDNASGGFTWVDGDSLGAGTGVTSLNSLTGALNIVGNTQIGVSPSGSDVNLSVNSGSIGATELASTAVTASSYGSASQVATFTVDADGRLTAAGNTAIAINANQITAGTLTVNRGGTGTGSHTAGGILLGNGTSAIQNTGVLTNGQLLIGDGSGAPTIGTLTQGTGITVTNGAGTITIASTLGTSIETGEITNGTIQAVDLESTNAAGAGTDNYLLTYDNATGGFTYVDGGTVGTTLDEATVESYIFDGDNSGTLSSGTLALGSLSYTGNLTVSEGGTGMTSAGAAGGVYYSTGTAFANSGAGTAGQCLLSNGAGAPTWGNCGGSGAGAVTLQVAYDQGNTITTTNARNLTYTLANTTTDSDFIVNIATSSTSEIAFQYNASTLLRIDSNGIDLIDVDVADFTGANVTFDAGEIAETEIAQNSLDDSEIQDNSLTAGSLAPNSVNTSELASTSVSSGSYGNASNVATFTVDADGRLTAANSTAIAIAATQITSGTLNDARLSTNVALLDRTGQTFTGTNTFSAAGTALTVTNNASVGGALTVTGTSDLGNVDATGTTNGTNFTFNGYNNTTGDQDIFVINDSDSGGSGQDESSTLKVNRSGAIDVLSTGHTVAELLYSGGGSLDDEEAFYILGRTTNEGEVNWGISLNDSDFVTSGAVRAGATPQDCGGTSTACLTSPSISLEADGSIAQSGSTILTTGGVLQNVTNANAGTFFTGGTLPVSRGGTGASTLAAGVLFGNGTGAITSTGTMSNGQLLIGDGSGAPSLATLTQGTGITVTNGAGTISIASTLGTNIDSGEIVNGTIQEIDLEATNAPTDNYLLSYDSATGGFTWIDAGTVGSTLDEATVESYIFDADNSGTLSSGTLALNSLSYTGDLNDAQVANNLTISSSGTVDGGALTAGTVANGALANSSVTIGTGSGLTGGGGVSLGGSLSLSLSALTGDWNQTGAFDITLNNASSELRILESSGATYYGTFDVGNLSSNQTYTFNQGGTVLTTGNISSSATTGVTAGSGLTGGGTNGVLSLDVGAGTGILVNANDIEVEYGSTAGTAVEGNTQITISPGTGITGGGSITLGSGGSVTITNELGDSIASNEIVNGTIQEIDLEVTNAPTDNYILSYDTATGGFTWVDPTGVGVNEATVEAYIFDGDNSGTLSSGTLDLNSLGYTGTLSVGYGGTGLSAAGTAGTVFFSNGTGFANTAQGTSGQCLLSNGSGTPSWGNCGGGGAGAVTLQVAYGNGNQIDTTDNRNIIFNLADTTTDSDFLINLQGAGSLFDVQDSGTSKLTVDGAGNVGINDATPSYQLDVAGTGRFTNNLIVDGNTTLGNASTDTTTVNGDLDVLDRAGIGAAAVGSHRLYVSGNAGDGEDIARFENNSGNLLLKLGGNAGSENMILSMNPGSSASQDFGIAGYSLTNISNFNVYADNTNLNGQLEVRRANHQIAFYDTDTATTEWTITTTNDENLSFYENGTTNVLTVEAGGNVGIGTLNPTHNLTVNGTSYLDGATTINVGRGDVYIENNANDNTDGAGLTVRTSNNPTSGSIFAVRSSAQAARLWVGQSYTSSGENGFLVGTDTDGFSNPAIEMTTGGLIQFQQATGSKINLYTTTYGFGVSSNTLDVFSNRYVSFRDASVSGTERVQFDLDNGNVGIAGALRDLTDGTLNISDSLAVTGSATIASTLAANNGITVDGNTVIDNGAGWHRTYNDTGWYNQTHGGGIYMTDATWLRAYSATGFVASQFYASSHINIGSNVDIRTGTSASGIALFDTSPNNPNQSVGIRVDGPMSSWALGYSRTVNVGTTNVCRTTSTGADPDVGNVFTVGHCGSSSLRYKKNIVSYSAGTGLDKVRQLNPVTFNYKASYSPSISDSDLYVGFIAEEIEAIDPLLAEYDENGVIESVQYEKVAVLLTSGIKELDLQVQNHESRLASLESSTASLTKKNITVTNTINTLRLKVTGLTELVDLKVSGNTEVADITVNGKIITAGNEPTAVLGATTTGNGSTYTIEGNDTAGTITFTTGTDTTTNPLAAGTQITVTFDEAFDEVPRVNLTPINSESATVDYYVTRTETSFKVRFVNVPDASTSYSFDYQILQ